MRHDDPSQITRTPWYLTIDAGGCHVQSAALNEDNYICNVEGRTPAEAKANAHLIAAAPELLIALEEAFALLDRISDTLHYEDGLPVTFLESRDIEIIYGDAVTELARFETLIREARGQQ